MNWAILAGSVIVGIAVIFSMSMMPANADLQENLCISGPPNFLTICSIPIVDGQHTMYMVPGSRVLLGGCHFVVDDFSATLWKLNLDHGPEKCLSFTFILKSSVVVRGS